MSKQYSKAINKLFLIIFKKNNIVVVILLLLKNKVYNIVFKHFVLSSSKSKKKETLFKNEQISLSHRLKLSQNYFHSWGLGEKRRIGRKALLHAQGPAEAAGEKEQKKQGGIIVRILLRHKRRWLVLCWVALRKITFFISVYLFLQISSLFTTFTNNDKSNEMTFCTLERVCKGYKCDQKCSFFLTF